MHQNIFFELFDFNLDSIAYNKVIIDYKVNEIIKETVRFTHFLLPQDRLNRT
ncbi:hypothetical protein D3C80_2128370 [compost metagenome]